MEKEGNFGGFNAPPPPYGYTQDNVPLTTGPRDGEYDPNCQKVPLYPNPNPAASGYPMVVPQGPYCAQQPMGYGQQPQQVIFVQPTALTNPPQDHLGYSIFVTICCCWMVGLFAIIKSAECRSAVAAGDRTKAELMSREAKKYGNVALCLGIVSLIATAVLFGVYYGLLNNYSQNHF